MNRLSKPNVLMLLENNPFPQDARVRREALALTQAGYGVFVICQRGDQQPWHENQQGVQVYRYPAPPTGSGLIGYVAEYGYSLLAAFVLSWWVWLRHGFAVVHTHNPPDFLVVIALFYKLFGKKYVFDHHDLAPDMYLALYGERANPMLHRILLFFERISLRAANSVISTNQSYRQVALTRGNVPPARVHIVRNGPDLARFSNVAADADLRARAQTIIGYVGDMGQHDGLDYLLRALHHLVYTLKRTDVYAVLIGRGNAWESLQTLAHQLNLTDHVWFTGWVTNEALLRYLASADICVDPDPYNSFTDRSSMIKMTEYMALGKPIVAFDLTEHRATAQEAAVYAQRNDEADFARAIATLIDDPARRAAMGQLGRQRVEQELSWQYSIPPLLAAYDQLFGKTARVPANKWGWQRFFSH